MKEKVLFVDDEVNILNAYQRQTRKHYAVEIAEGGRKALEIMDSRGPFAVIVADMNMPEMNGIRFLSLAREKEPDGVRIMLTGQADIETAIQAVNESNIFRFLTKPCPQELLIKALDAGIDQYRLILAEKELLEQTLKGSVNVLTEILSLINPMAFSRASRIRQYVRHIAGQLDLPDVWQYEVASLLSQIGCVTVPSNVLDKLYALHPLEESEKNMFSSHPVVGSKLLSKIPRLDKVAKMIEWQQRGFSSFSSQEKEEDGEKLVLGAQILRVALDLDQLVISGKPQQAAFFTLRVRKEEYDPRVIEALENYDFTTEDRKIVKEITVEELNTEMVTGEDIRAKGGLLLVPKGQEVTYTVLARLRNFAQGAGVEEPFRVFVSASPVRESQEAPC